MVQNYVSFSLSSLVRWLACVPMLICISKALATARVAQHTASWVELLVQEVCISFHNLKNCMLPQHGLSKTGFAMLFPVPASLTHLIVDVYNRCCIKIGFNNLLSLDSFVKYFRLSYLLPIFTFLPIPWTSSTTPSSSFVADSLPNLCFAGFFPRTLIALHDTRLPTENGIIVGDAQN